jgi:hypothetical protein
MQHSNDNRHKFNNYHEYHTFNFAGKFQMDDFHSQSGEPKVGLTGFGVLLRTKWSVLGACLGTYDWSYFAVGRFAVDDNREDSWIRDSARPVGFRISKASILL